jgi:hypothetical protein
MSEERKHRYGFDNEEMGLALAEAKPKAVPPEFDATLWTEAEDNTKGFIEKEDEVTVAKKRKGKRLPPTPIDEVAHAKAQAAIEKQVMKVFRKTAKSVAAQVRRKLKVPAKLSKAEGNGESPDDYISYSLDDLNTLTEGNVPDALADVYIGADQATLAVIGARYGSGIVNQVNTRANAWAQDRAAELVGMKWVDEELVDNPNAEWAITQSTRDMLNATISQGLDEGWGVDGIARAIENMPDAEGLNAFTPERARMISLTECLVGPTLVDGAVVRAAYRRWYEGDVFEIVTETGRSFTTTPNHPMLTQRGWVASSLLCNSDYLVCDSGQKKFGASVNEDINYHPTSIAQIFEALCFVPGIAHCERRAGFVEDFHGDGRLNCDVNVARPYRELTLGLFTKLHKHVIENFFPEPNLSAFCFCHFCGGLLPINKTTCFCNRSQFGSSLFQIASDNFTIYRKMIGKLSKGFTVGIAGSYFFSRQALNKLIWSMGQIFIFSGVGPISDDIGFSYNANCNVKGYPSFKPSVGDRTTTFVGFANHVSQLFRNVVSFFSLKSKCFKSGSPLWDFSFDNTINNPVGCVGERDNFGTAVSSIIELDNIKFIRRKSFSGHVFNLSTDCGYFTITGGVYTGNTLDAHNSGALDGYYQAQDAGVNIQKEWFADAEACDICLENVDAGPIDLDEVFPSGDDAPTAHPRCQCSIIPYLPDEEDSGSVDESDLVTQADEG